VKRFVIDTNVVVSALLWGGLSQKSIDIIQQNDWNIIATKELLEELSRTLSKPKLSPVLRKASKPALWFVNQYTTLITWVSPVFVPPNVIRDPKDAMVLACAVGGQADAIITGDKNLLVMASYNNIAILSPQSFVLTYKDPS
jgi:putative PIN family toxin of toxin-antitoxin system